MKNKMLYFFDVLYHYFYIQHKKYLSKISPHNQAAVMLGTITGFNLLYFIDAFYTLLFCSPSPPWIFISICFICIFLMLFIYEWKGRKNKVVKEKPLFFNNYRLTVAIAIVIDIIGLSKLFLGGPLGRYLLQLCKDNFIG